MASPRLQEANKRKVKLLNGKKNYARRKVNALEVCGSHILVKWAMRQEIVVLVMDYFTGLAVEDLP